MQEVSNRWRELHNEPLLPENFIQITYKVTGAGINDTYETAENGAMPWSNAQDLSESNPYCPKYATLELNQWVLDGSLKSLPAKDYENGRFVSSHLSGEDCYFATRPVLTLNWSSQVDVTVPGVTIQWSKTYDEFPTAYYVRVYNDNNLLAEVANLDNDSALNVLLVDIEQFNRIEVEIVKWNLPHHRARIEQLFVGVINTYEKGDLISYTHENFCDILSGELPRNTITFSLDNTDNKWNPLNPQGKYKYLLEQQTMRVRYGMNVDGTIEWIDGGVFFLNEWHTPSNGIEATFTAESMLTFMDVPYTGSRAGTLLQVAEEAIMQIDLPDDASYYFDSSLGAVQVDFAEVDSEYLVSEVLQMVANAGECIMYQDRSGCLRIEPANMAVSDYIISKFVSYSHPEFDISKELKVVNVNDGMAVVENSPKGAVQTMDNPIVTNMAHAESVGTWAANILKNRRTVSGDYRADTSLSAGDMVTVENKFNDRGNDVFITSITYSFNGAFRASYEGRVIE